MVFYETQASLAKYIVFLHTATLSQQMSKERNKPKSVIRDILYALSPTNQRLYPEGLPLGRNGKLLNPSHPGGMEPPLRHPHNHVSSLRDVLYKVGRSFYLAPILPGCDQYLVG